MEDFYYSQKCHSQLIFLLVLLLVLYHIFLIYASPKKTPRTNQVRGVPSLVGRPLPRFLEEALLERVRCLLGYEAFCGSLVELGRDVLDRTREPLAKAWRNAVSVEVSRGACTDAVVDCHSEVSS